MFILDRLFVGVEIITEIRISVAFGIWSVHQLSKMCNTVSFSGPCPRASAHTLRDLILLEVVLRFARSPGKQASSSGISLALTCE